MIKLALGWNLGDSVFLVGLSGNKVLSYANFGT